MNYFLPLHCGAPDMAKLNSSDSSKLNKNIPAPRPLDKIKTNLGSYLAGLYEGDGHISFASTSTKSTYQYNPRFNITFNIKDKPLADKLLVLIKKFSGIESGFIRLKINENACVLTISNLEILVFIVNLMNGKLRGPKIYTFHKLIDWLNSSNKLLLNIPKLGTNSNSLTEDGWLAGFVDADGCFYIRVTPKTEKSKRRIACRFSLEQRMVDPKSKLTYEKLFLSIAKFLITKLNVRIQTVSNRQYYIVSASSLKSIPVILEYFSNYPLFSSKYLDYKD